MIGNEINSIRLLNKWFSFHALYIGDKIICLCQPDNLLYGHKKFVSLVTVKIREFNKDKGI